MYAKYLMVKKDPVSILMELGLGLEVTSKGLDRPVDSVVCWPYLQDQYLGIIQYNPSKFTMMIVYFSMPYCPTSPYSHHVLRDTLGRSFPCLFFPFIPFFLFPKLPS